MRRNAESLLVLAGSESPRVWAKAAEMSDVVRAAVSEVDEYQRVEVVALEPARLSGGAVTDIAHLLAELLENAVQFSPPTEAIRVTGLFGVDGYEISISDKGMGLSDSRVSELNRILERPPSLGLSVEPTMGIHVVAKLAYRHGLTVQLIRSVPGVTAKVAVPRGLLELVPAQPDSASTHRPEGVYEPVEVVDLTQPAMTEPAEAVPEPVAFAETVPDALPVRVPGEAFRDEDLSPGVVAGSGADTIKSALGAYDRGRRAAERGEAEVEGEEER
jgi:anti-sigma regulatory factor (Ser/Thr protein kinase)